jgi:hypothetical protein
VSDRAESVGEVSGLKKGLVVLLAFLVGQTVLAVDMPSAWDFGTRSDDAPLTHSFIVRNTAGASVAVSTLVSCECLSVVPSTFTLAKRSSARIRVTFDPKGSRGAVSKLILVSVRGGESVDRTLTVRGTIDAKAAGAPSEGCALCGVREEDLKKAAAASSRPQSIDVRYYYSGDCASCTRFIESDIPRLQTAVGRRIAMDLRDIRTGRNVEEILQVLAKKGMTLTAFPVIVVDDTVLQGEKEIRARLESVLREKAGVPGS